MANVLLLRTSLGEDVVVPVPCARVIGGGAEVDAEVIAVGILPVECRLTDGHAVCTGCEIIAAQRHFPVAFRDSLANHRT